MVMVRSKSAALRVEFYLSRIRRKFGECINYRLIHSPSVLTEFKITTQETNKYYVIIIIKTSHYKHMKHVNKKKT